MKSQKLIIEGDGVDVEYLSIPKKVARRILDNGVSEEELDDLSLKAVTEGGIFNATIKLGGKSIQFLDLENVNHSDAQKVGGRRSWFLVKQQFERGVLREIVFDGKFDFKELAVNPNFFDLNGFDFGYFDVSYSGLEGNVGETTPSYGGDWFLIDPMGHRFDVASVDEDSDPEALDDSESEPNYSTASREASLVQRTYVFSSKVFFLKFREYWREERQPNIDEGLDDIRAVKFDDKNYNVVIVGERRDVSFLPGNNLEWAVKAFGKFTVNDQELD